MTKRLYAATLVQMVLIALITVTPSLGQGGRGGRGMMGDGAHAADMQLFHQLFEHRTEIDRQVIAREDGTFLGTDPGAGARLKRRVRRRV